jgi:hypothetical protein
MIKVRFLFSGNFDIEGQPRHYEKGDTDTIPLEDANRLALGLIVEIVKEEVKRERKNSK